VHVCLHEICDNIDVLKPMVTFVRLLHVEQGDYVFMVKEAQQFNFSDYSLSINQVFKSIVNFLNCDFHVVFLVHS
jgi:hypothetical protein